jgi:hypothetical protein
LPVSEVEVNISLPIGAQIPFFFFVGLAIVGFTIKQYLLPRNGIKGASYSSTIARANQYTLAVFSWTCTALAVAIVFLFGERSP